MSPGEVGGLGAVVTLACVGAASLALAQAGRHNGWGALALGLVVAALVLGVPLVAWRHRLSIRLDRAEVALVVGTLAATLFFFLPGFPYAYGDKDPGIYVAHAFAIEREGSVDLPNPIIEQGLDYDRFHHLFLPGVYEGRASDSSTSQFYQYYSALTATGLRLVGERGVFDASPVFAALSVLLFMLAVRRAAGTVPAAIATALLTTSMMQVWQAKYPSTEILAQLMLSGAILAAVLAIQRRWPPAAYLGGFLVTVGFLVRPDGFLYVVLTTALLAGAVALGKGRDPRVPAAALGLLTPLPFALWNTYHARARYSAVNGVPPWNRLLLIMAALVIGGILTRRAYTWWKRRPGVRQAPVPWSAQWRRLQPWVAAAIGAATVGMLLLLWYRARIFGMDTRDSLLAGTEVDNLNVWNLRTLALFVTLPGLALMVAGLVVVIRERSRLSLYVVLLPGLTVLPIYLWDARISMYLMWWVRRFVPGVLPAIMLLIALALTWGLTYRVNGRHRRADAATLLLRGTAALVTVVLIGTYARQSLPLRSHHELRGSQELAEQVATLAPAGEGVFLFTAYDGEATDVYNPMRNTATPVWWMFDQTAARLPPNQWSQASDDARWAMGASPAPRVARWGLDQVAAQVPSDTWHQVVAYATTFPDQTVFVVTDQTELPDYLPADRFELRATIPVSLDVWTERTVNAMPDNRPTAARTLTYEITVWELTDG